MDWKVTTQPAIEPVTLAEAKLQCKVDTDLVEDDDLITSKMKAARQWCEFFQNRAYIEQSITAKFDAFLGDTIILPMPPLISVTSVKYLDGNGTQQTLDPSYYDVDTTSEPGRITLGYNDTWPTTRDQHHAIEIIFKAGYGATAASVPELTKSAILLLTEHLYENRSATSEEALKEIPLGVKNLLLDRNF